MQVLAQMQAKGNTPQNYHDANESTSNSTELKIIQSLHLHLFGRGGGGEGGKKQGLGPRNDVLTTCKAIR